MCSIGPDETHVCGAVSYPSCDERLVHEGFLL